MPSIIRMERREHVEHLIEIRLSMSQCPVPLLHDLVNGSDEEVTFATQSH